MGSRHEQPESFSDGAERLKFSLEFHGLSRWKQADVVKAENAVSFNRISMHFNEEKKLNISKNLKNINTKSHPCNFVIS